jgi:hypothetical protein
MVVVISVILIENSIDSIGYRRKTLLQWTVGCLTSLSVGILKCFFQPEAFDITTCEQVRRREEVL